MLLPFTKPAALHAQQNNPDTPTCELKLDKITPNLVCVSPSTTPDIKITPGDSNLTVAAAKAEAERQARLKKISAARKSSYSNIPTMESGNITVLYSDAGQCVPFARAYSGIQISGTAKNIPINSSTPEVGAVVITYESGAGHAAVVTGISGDILEVIERNFEPGKVTKRKLSINSGLIKGFVLPNM